MLNYLRVGVCAALFGVALWAPSAAAAPWTLSSAELGCNQNDDNPCQSPPNGYVVDFPGGFTLYGDDTHHLVAIMTYTTVADVGAYTFSWDYLNHEPPGFGSYQDPAGYVIDGVLTQLTVDFNDGMCGASFCSPRAQSGGPLTVHVNPGQTFGFYVKDLDGGYGRGDLTIRFAPSPGAVPEPATWALLILGFGGVGASIRRRGLARA